MNAQVIDLTERLSVRPADGPAPRTPPGPTIIEPFPTGMRVVADLPALAFRVARLLDGRDAVLTFANAGWPGLDTFPIWNVKAPSSSPQGGSATQNNDGGRDWVCAVHLPLAFPLPVFEAALRAEGVTLITPTKETARHA